MGSGEDQAVVALAALDANFGFTVLADADAHFFHGVAPMLW